MLINYLSNRQECLDSKRGFRGNAPAPIFLDYLVVGGGQYGAVNAGGGGGVVSGSIRFLPRFTLDITVGDGGTGSILKDAQPSIIDVSNPSGEFFVYAGGGQNVATSGQPQLNPGGNPQDSVYSFGGAGGSAQSGFDASGAIGGTGGSGSIWIYDNISSQPYGGGGGGFGNWFIPGEAVGGTGGQGGGGNGAAQSGAGSNGVNNLGGGGGGCQSGSACNGGSGLVKLRYLSGSVSGAIGGTISTSGSYVYHTFTSSGQFIYQP